MRYAFTVSFVKVEGEQESLRYLVTYVEDITRCILKNDERLATNNFPPNYSLKNKILQHIMGQNEDFDIDVYEKYGIDPSEILLGIECPQCEQFKMKRIPSYKWKCQHCQAYSQYAHVKALYEYTLLFSSEISNAQCRTFLQIESRHTIKYLLQTTSSNQKKANRDWKINPRIKNMYKNWS